mgnify:CR=1 FL=1
MALTQVKTSGIADDAVTLAKQATGTDGNIISYDASGNPVAIATGDDGQVLTSTGAGSPPAFEAILANDANNRVVTGTGSGLNGEANLTFDGNNLAQTIDASGEGVKITAAGDHYAAFVGDSNRSLAARYCTSFQGKWNGTTIGSLNVVTGADNTNKDDGKLEFSTASSGTENVQMTIDSSGFVGIGETDPETLLSLKGDDTAYSGDIASGAIIQAEDSAGRKVQLVAPGSTAEAGVGTPTNHALTLFTGNIERVRVDTVGNVGLGGVQAAPTSTIYNGASLHLHQSASGAGGGSQIKMTTSISGSAAGDGAYLAYYGNNVLYIYNKENANIEFGTNSTPRFSIGTDGNVTIDDGNLVVANGHGIDFSAAETGTATSGAQKLDAYEEGTWTIQYDHGTGSIAADHSVGKYIKIGNLCTAWLGFEISGASSATYPSFSLPFAQKIAGTNSDARATGSVMMHSVNWEPDHVQATAYIGTEGDDVKIFMQRDNASWEQLANTEISVGDWFYITITYQTA